MQRPQASAEYKDLAARQMAFAKDALVLDAEKTEVAKLAQRTVERNEKSRVMQVQACSWLRRRQSLAVSLATSSTWVVAS